MKKLNKALAIAGLVSAASLLAGGVAAGDWKSSTRWACEALGNDIYCPMLREVHASDTLNYVDMVAKKVGNPPFTPNCYVVSSDSTRSNVDFSAPMPVSSTSLATYRFDISGMQTWSGGSYYLFCGAVQVDAYDWNEN